MYGYSLGSYGRYRVYRVKEHCFTHTCSHICGRSSDSTRVEPAILAYATHPLMITCLHVRGKEGRGGGGGGGGLKIKSLSGNPGGG